MRVLFMLRNLALGFNAGVVAGGVATAQWGVALFGLANVGVVLFIDHCERSDQRLSRQPHARPSRDSLDQLRR